MLITVGLFKSVSKLLKKVAVPYILAEDGVHFLFPLRFWYI